MSNSRLSPASLETRWRGCKRWPPPHLLHALFSLFESSFVLYGTAEPLTTTLLPSSPRSEEPPSSFYPSGSLSFLTYPLSCRAQTQTYSFSATPAPPTPARSSGIWTRAKLHHQLSWVLQLVDGSSWDLSASINMGANSSSQVCVCVCVCVCVLLILLLWRALTNTPSTCF